MQEITIAALRKHGSMTESCGEETRTYRIIKAYDAKNYDGTSAGIQRDTPDGERELIEQCTIRRGKRTYANWW